MNTNYKKALGFVVALGLIVASSASAASAPISFATNLKFGARSADVKALQVALNSCADTMVAVTGAGSAGYETMYFGPATLNAAKAYQTKNAITPVSGMVGPLTRAKLAAVGNVCGTNPNPTPTPQTGSVTASLAMTNPASSTLVAGSAAADLAHFAFSNGTSTPVKVSNVTLMRNGISIDTTLTNVFLYQGVSRLTDSATVSNGMITFNDPTGLFTIPANSSVVISVRADILAGVSGQTVGVTLTSFMVAGATGSSTVNVAGNLHATATVTGMATVDFATTTNPTSSTVDPQTDYTMWQNVATIGNRDAWLRSLRLRQIGSVATSDLQNFRLYVDGVMVGSAVSSLDSMGYITFDLSASPVKLLSGGRTIKVLGDIVGGSSRTFSFSLRQASDAWITDSQLGTNILATANSLSFSARTSTSATINSGTLSITKQSNSPSGNTVNGAPGVVLARYDVKAFGEAMKIENLSVRIDEDDADTTYTLRNGAVYLDGVQIGSTTAIAGDTDATQAYTSYTFGSAAVIYPGTTRVLEIRADIYNNDGSNDVVADDTIQAEIVTGSSNVQRMASLTYGSYPAAAVEGGILTVSTGSITIAKNTSYANTTTTVPKTAYLLGSYNFQANTTEGSNITSIVVDFDTVADAFDASDDVTNLWLKINGQTTGAGGIKSTVADSANTFSTNVNIASGQTYAVEVYGDVASSATDGDGTADTGISSITVSYLTTGGSSTSTTATEVTGQTVTFGTGTFTSALDGTSPLNRIIAGNQEVVGAAFKFTAANETYTIKELKAKVASAAIGSVVSSVNFYDGATLLGSAPLSQDTNTAALVTGLNVVVNANTTKTITAKLTLNAIGTGAGTSQSNAALTLDSVKYADSQGAETTSGTDRAGNEMYVYKSIPTITQVDLSNGTLVNGQATDIYKFTVAASSQGPIAIKQLTLPITWSDGGTADTLEVESLKLYEDGTDITANVVIQDQAGNSVESTSGLLEADTALTISWATTLEGTVGAGSSKTYTVRGTPTGFRATGADTVGDTISMYLAGDSTHNGSSTYVNGVSGITTIWGVHTAAAATGSGTATNFIWSDNSSSVHAADENASSSADWANGYKVLNFDLGGESWTK